MVAEGTVRGPVDREDIMFPLRPNSELRTGLTTVQLFLFV